jgi:hypothetical protein
MTLTTQDLCGLKSVQSECRLYEFCPELLVHYVFIILITKCVEI